MLPPELEQAYELVDVLRRTRRASVLAVRARTNGELLVVKIGPPAPRIGDTTLGSLAPLLWGEHATSSLIRHERDVLVTLDGQGGIRLGVMNLGANGVVVGVGRRCRVGQLGINHQKLTSPVRIAIGVTMKPK